MKTPLDRMHDDLQLRGSRPNTIRSYLGSVSQLQRFYGRCPSKLTAEEVRTFLLHLVQKRHLAKSSIATCVAALRFFYKVTVRRSALADTLVAPRYRRHPHLVLSQEEVRRLVETARTPKARAIVALLYGAGLRASELCKLRSQDIDSRRGVLWIRDGKGGKARQLMLSAHLLRCLRIHWKNRSSNATAYLFPGRPPSVTMSTRAINYLISRLRRDARIIKGHVQTSGV